MYVAWENTGFIWDSSRLIYVRKWFPWIDGLQGCVECKISWSNCPCGKTLPGFSPKISPWVSFTCGVNLTHVPQLQEIWKEPTPKLQSDCGVWIVCGAENLFSFFAVAYLSTVRGRILLLWIFQFKLEGRNLIGKPNISTYSLPFEIVKIIMPKAIN